VLQAAAPSSAVAKNVTKVVQGDCFRIPYRWPATGKHGHEIDTGRTFSQATHPSALPHHLRAILCRGRENTMIEHRPMNEPAARTEYRDARFE
jgi:hypothetical protein